MFKIKHILRWSLLAGMLVLSACAPGSSFQDPTAVPDEPETPPASPIPSEWVPTATIQPTSSVEPTATPIPDAAAGCPTPSDDSLLYISLENGYCFLYPASFEQNTSLEQGYDRVVFLSPLVESNAMQTLRVFLTVETNGPADELDSFQYALKWIEWFAPGLEPERETGFIGGQPAVLFYDLPAYGPGEQSAFVIANGFKYRITLSPQEGDVPELDEQAQKAWDRLTSTIVFFEPQSERSYVRPEDVCPQGDTDFKLYTHLTDGYCLLYPADFEQTPDFPGQFVGGPVLEAGTAWGDVRASLTVGTFGYYPDQSVLQVMEPRSDVIDTTSIVETTIAGYPAVIFREPRGPWASRQAMISVEGFVYTLVHQPWEPGRYPAGMPYLDRIWETVTGSLAFFDPWR